MVMLLGASRQEFEAFDVNKDGLIDVLDIRARMREKFNVKQMFAFFASADLDQSGTISFDEYQKIQSKNEH